MLKGRDNIKKEPAPTLDSTSRSPPKACAKFLLIVKPKPTPSLLSSRLSMIFVKFENNFLTYFFVIPTPES